MIHPHPLYSNYGADSDGSCFGRSRSKRYKYATDWHPIKLMSQASGYTRFNVTDRLLGRRQFLTHHFVWECLTNTTPNWSNRNRDSLTINHINGIKTDNRISNLEILSLGENARDGNVGRNGIDCHDKTDLSVFRDTSTNTTYVSTQSHLERVYENYAFRQAPYNKSRRSKNIVYLGKLSNLSL